MLQLLKISFLLVLVGLPLMGGDCGGSVSPCIASKDAFSCNELKVCVWKNEVVAKAAHCNTAVAEFSGTQNGRCGAHLQEAECVADSNILLSCYWYPGVKASAAHCEETQKEPSP